jgi:hypothetical protein
VVDNEMGKFLVSCEYCWIFKIALLHGVQNSLELFVCTIIVTIFFLVPHLYDPQILLLWVLVLILHLNTLTSFENCKVFNISQMLL